MNDRVRIQLELPPLDVATVAWLLDVCGQLSHVLLKRYGDQLERYWSATEPGQPIAGPLRPPRAP